MNFEQSKNEIIKTPEVVKEGVDFVFEQNPELTQIGTKEQYSEYLDTIFSDSKVKDIVYHGTTKGKFEKFNTTGSTDNIGRLGSMAGSLKAANLQRGKQERPEWVRPEEWEEPLLPENSNLYSLNFNLKNPFVANSLDAAMKLDRNTLLKEGYDGVIIEGFEEINGRLEETGFGDEYVVFEPEQIHILGSKEDIAKFKEFVSFKKN